MGADNEPIVKSIFCRATRSVPRLPFLRFSSMSITLFIGLIKNQSSPTTSVSANLLIDA